MYTPHSSSSSATATARRLPHKKTKYTYTYIYIIRKQDIHVRLSGSNERGWYVAVNKKYSITISHEADCNVTSYYHSTPQKSIINCRQIICSGDIIPPIIALSHLFTYSQVSKKHKKSGCSSLLNYRMN